MFTELLGYSELDKESRWAALQYRGLAQLILENHAEALADFDHAIELEPDDASLVTLRSETLHRMNRHDEALVESERAIQLQPDNAFAFYVRGKCYRDKGEYGRALEDFSRAIELSPADASLIGARGLLLRGLERYEDALADFDRALELDPNLPWVLSSRGAIHKQAGRYDDALIDFRRALELDPDHLWNIAEMAEIYWLTGQYEEALAELEHVEELPPDDPATAVVLVRQIHILMSKDNSVAVNQAVDRLEDYLAVLPSSVLQDEWSSIPPAFRDRLGVRSGGFKGSVKDWLALIKSLTSEENWEAMATIRHSITVSEMVDKNNERPDQALIICNRALGASPDDPTIIALRARIYRRMGSYDQSIADLDRAIELVPAFDRYLYEKVLTLKARGQRQKGDAVLEQAISRVSQRHAKDPQNWHTALDLALCYLVSGDAGRAKSVIERALSDEIHPAFIFSAIGDLEDLLVLFPTNSDARALLNLLETHLQETDL